MEVAKSEGTPIDQIIQQEQTIMANLTHPKLIWLKGLLFVVLGLMASAVLIARNPEVISALLLAVAIWAFCRAYYFAFYVIEHYVDPTYRFAGLVDFVRYAALGGRADRQDRS